MSTLQQRAQAHFLEKRERLVSVEVPEWGGRVYFHPAMSARERAAIWKYYGDGDNYGAILESILVRALDENGRRLFAEAARDELRDRYDPDVLERISIEMGSFDEPMSADEKKS